MDDLARRPGGERERRRIVRSGEAIGDEASLAAPGRREWRLGLALEPALDDDLPAPVEAAIRAQEAVLDLWTIRLGGER